MRPFSRAVLSLLAVATLLACGNLSTVDEQPNRYAALNMVAQNNGSGAARGTATLVFFKGGNVTVPNSALSQFDQCIISALDTTTLVSTGMNPIGGSPALAVGTRNLPLTYNTSLARYETTAAQPFTYTTGESATITIPDGGSVFPAATLTVKLAEPIIPTAVTLPAANADWALRWNGANDDLSSIQLQLSYATTATATRANEQVYCVLKDDGAAAIPAVYLTGFLSSPNARRAMRMLRWRTNERVLDRSTLLHVASTVDTIITFP